MRVSVGEEDNVFCGSVMPLCLMRGSVFFEKLEKFLLLVYNLNTVCVFLYLFALSSSSGCFYRPLGTLCFGVMSLFLVCSDRK